MHLARGLAGEVQGFGRGVSVRAWCVAEGTAGRWQETAPYISREAGLSEREWGFCHE